MAEADEKWDDMDCRSNFKNSPVTAPDDLKRMIATRAKRRDQENAEAGAMPEKQSGTSRP